MKAIRLKKSLYLCSALCCLVSYYGLSSNASAQSEPAAAQPYPAWAVNDPYKDQPATEPLKVTIPNISAVRDAAVQHTAVAQTQAMPRSPSHLPNLPPAGATNDSGHSENVFNQLFSQYSDNDSTKHEKNISVQAADTPVEPPAPTAPPVITKVYQSPPAVIQKQTLHMATPQPEAAPPPPPAMVAELTPAELAKLNPTAGDDAPLIPIPPMPVSPAAITAQPALPPVAAPLPPSAPVATTPMPVTTPTVPKPLAVDVKPLLDTLPTAAKTASTAPVPPSPLPPITPPTSAEKAANAQANSEPAPTLSPESKAIAAKIPSNIDHKKEPVGAIAVDRAKPKEKALGDAEPAVESNKPRMGIRIETKIPAADVNYQLEEAYNAFNSGQSAEAIDIYKNILSNDPKNKSALFGLATLYHRAGQIEPARAFYSQLLTLDPDNHDGLNNFLVLMADEAPQEALTEMQALEARNPNFSNIPAQMAIIYEKQGNFDKAGEKMFRAVELAPENLTYRYNLAIMLDKQKKYEEAAKLYAELVKAYDRGEVIPGNIQNIQQRLTFISSNRS